MMGIAKKIGKAIKEARQEQKMTQRDLAIKSEIEQGYLSKVENGEINSKIDTIQAIVVALGGKLIIDFKGDENEKEN